jgi:hypothetical protein
MDTKKIILPTDNNNDNAVIDEIVDNLTTENYINSLGVDTDTGLSESQAKILLAKNGENVLSAESSNT